MGPRLVLSTLSMCTLTPLLYVAEQISNEADLATWRASAAIVFALASALAFIFLMERFKRSLD